MRNEVYTFIRGTSGVKKGVLLGRVDKGSSLKRNSKWNEALLLKNAREQMPHKHVDVSRRYERLILEAEGKLYLIPSSMAHRVRTS